MGKREKIIIYADGGSKGNPGPAAIGVMIQLDGVPKTYNKSIGQATNNVAEYRAVIFALHKLKQLIGKERAKKTQVEIRSDSELLVKQQNAEYKIKEPNLQLLFIELWNLRQDFGDVAFKLIPRGKNTAADRLVNEALF